MVDFGVCKNPVFSEIFYCLTHLKVALRGWKIKAHICKG